MDAYGSNGIRMNIGNYYTPGSLDVDDYYGSDNSTSGGYGGYDAYGGSGGY
jgi:hypothetical protein